MYRRISEHLAYSYSSVLSIYLSVFRGLKCTLRILCDNHMLNTSARVSTYHLSDRGISIKLTSHQKISHWQDQGHWEILKNGNSRSFVPNYELYKIEDTTVLAFRYFFRGGCKQLLALPGFVYAALYLLDPCSREEWTVCRYSIRYSNKAYMHGSFQVWLVWNTRHMPSSV